VVNEERQKETENLSKRVVFGCEKGSEIERTDLGNQRCSFVLCCLQNKDPFSTNRKTL
jgi:hypothetical protein